MKFVGKIAKCTHLSNQNHFFSAIGAIICQKCQTEILKSAFPIKMYINIVKICLKIIIIVKMDNNGFELIITYSEILLICFESKVSETEILSKILEQLDINNQMFTIFSLEELLFMLKYLDFSCVIAL